MLEIYLLSYKLQGIKILRNKTEIKRDYSVFVLLFSFIWLLEYFKFNYNYT